MRGGIVYGSRDLVEFHHVHLERERAPSKPFDLGGEPRVGGFVAEAERDVRASTGQGQSDGAAEAASGTGDQGNLASKAEIRGFGHFRSFLLKPVPFTENRAFAETGRFDQTGRLLKPAFL